MIVGDLQKFEQSQNSVRFWVTENLLNKLSPLPTKIDNVYWGSFQYCNNNHSSVMCNEFVTNRHILSSQYSQTSVDCFSGISEFEHLTQEGLKWREVNPEIFELGIVGTKC